MNNLDESRKMWNNYASTFDDEPDHGLHDERIRAAWIKLLEKYLPEESVSILDIGCGTGSLSLVMAEQGHTITAADFSPEMIAHAKAKAEVANQTITFHVMDAANPKFEAQQFDVIVCRHLLWTLPEPEKVLMRWVDLLKTDGRLLLIEGFWETGAGLKAQQILDMMPSQMKAATIENLSDQSELWGKVVTDERYLISAQLTPKG